MFEQGTRRISVEPAEGYEIDCLIDFSHPLIGMQHLRFDLRLGAFGREITAARTFGFTHEVEAMRQAVGGWVVVDPTHQWTLNAESIKSSGKNTPFLGTVLTGKVGEVVV